MRHPDPFLGPCRCGDASVVISMHLHSFICDTCNYFAFPQVFVRFMRGRWPQIIVTDIDSDLRDAISIEMPNTKHIISIWKVLSKMSSWFSLPLGVQYSDFKSEFDMLCHQENVEDFEQRWNHMVARFGIGSDKHIDLLFSYRACWPFCYVRNFFLARTMTPEYSKLVETFLKNILTAEPSLQLFFKQVFAYDSTSRSVGLSISKIFLVLFLDSCRLGLPQILRVRTGKSVCICRSRHVSLWKNTLGLF